MAERVISAKFYVVVCAVLVLLTILTVTVSFFHIPEIWHLVIGLAIAMCKMSLVVLFFMHAVLSPRVVWIVIIVASFWLGILLVLALNDYFSRGMVPFMPGH